jgi:hypothetical protein
VGTSGAGAFARRSRTRDSAWERGASAERIVGAWLDRIPDVEVLHDRRVTGSRMSLDHVAVVPAGVLVIDVKRSGWPFALAAPRRTLRPAPGDRGHDKFLARVSTQARAVARLLADAPVPVAAALCLVDARGGEERQSFMFDGVWIGTPPALPELAGLPGLLDGEAMHTVAARLDARLG